MNDDNGVEFNSAIHKVKKDGTPIKRKGKFLVDKSKTVTEKPLDVAEGIMGSENKSLEQIVDEVKRAQTPANERLKERDDMDLSGLRDDEVVRNTGIAQVKKGFEFDYDVNRFEEILRDRVAKRLGQKAAAMLQVKVDMDDMCFHVRGALGVTDCGTLKMPIDMIVSCATKVLTVRSIHSTELRI